MIDKAILTGFEQIEDSKDLSQLVFALEKSIDLGIRPVDRGRSAGELRIWALIERGDFHRRIMEFEQYAQAATAIYQPQPPFEQWLKEVRGVFSPLDTSEYELVKLAEDSWFWVREKRVSLIDVPYTSKKDRGIKFRDGLATYDANQLGLAHSGQTQAAAYCRAIKTDTKAFRRTVKEVGIGYLRVARKAEARKGV